MKKVLAAAAVLCVLAGAETAVAQDSSVATASRHESVSYCNVPAIDIQLQPVANVFAGKLVGEVHPQGYASDPQYAMCLTVIVENVQPNGIAEVVIFNGDLNKIRRGVHREHAKIEGDRMRYYVGDKSLATITHNADGTFTYDYHNAYNGVDYLATLRKAP